MDISKALEGIEKLLLEILGYLLPGLILLGSVFTFLDRSYLKIALKSDDMNAWIVLGLGYVLGYFIHGIGIFKDRFYEGPVLKRVRKIGEVLSAERWWVPMRVRKFGKGLSVKKSDREKIESEIQSTLVYELTKALLGVLLLGTVDGTKDKIDALGLHDTRNLAMSYVPQSDRKVYTFMFRADLSELVGITALMFGLWGWIACVSSQLFNNTLLLVTNGYYFQIYLTLIVISYFLHKTRARFFRIAMSIPFSMFIASQTLQKEQ